eukprot:3306156-Prymnesium_polylepis.1
MPMTRVPLSLVRVYIGCQKELGHMAGAWALWPLPVGVPAAHHVVRAIHEATAPANAGNVDRSTRGGKAWMNATSFLDGCRGPDYRTSDQDVPGSWYFPFMTLGSPRRMELLAEGKRYLPGLQAYWGVDGRTAAGHTKVAKLLVNNAQRNPLPLYGSAGLGHAWVLDQPLLALQEAGRRGDTDGGPL